MPRRYESPIDRLLANSIIEDGCDCWIWVGARTNAGYGKLSFRFKRGPRKGTVKTVLAHRYAYQVFMEVRIAPKTVVRHTCDMKLCINPAHLIRGSVMDNNRDTVKRGRHGNQYRSPVRDAEVY